MTLMNGKTMFWDNANPSVDGTEIPGFVGTYQAEDLAGWWTGAPLVQDAPSRFLIGGEAIVLDANEDAVSGWVTGMFYTENVNGSVWQFACGGFRVGVVAFQQAAMSRGLTVRNPASGRGAQIAVVEAGSSAAAAGFQAGDVVVQANGAEIADMKDLAQRLQAAGEAVVPIIVLRDNERVEIDLPA